MPSNNSAEGGRTYIGPVYPGTETKHLVFPIVLALGGTIAGLDTAAAVGAGMLLVLLYGNMKWQSYFNGTVTRHEVER